MKAAHPWAQQHPQTLILGHFLPWLKKGTIFHFWSVYALLAEAKMAENGVAIFDLPFESKMSFFSFISFLPNQFWYLEYNLNSH